MINKVIKEAAEKVKQELLEGRFKIVSWGDFYVTVCVGDNLEFNLWHRGQEENLSIFSADDDLVLSKIKFTTSERDIIWSDLFKNKRELRDAQIEGLENQIKSIQDKIDFLKRN